MTLKIIESYTRDICKGVVRIDHQLMEGLGVSAGGVVEVVGHTRPGEAPGTTPGTKEVEKRRRIVARCLPLYPSDEGQSTIRIDGLGRRNIGSSIGDTVTVKKARVGDAVKVVVVAADAAPPITEQFMADMLQGLPLVVEDEVAVPYFGARQMFKVVDVFPKADVVVTPETVFQIVDQ